MMKTFQPEMYEAYRQNQQHIHTYDPTLILNFSNCIFSSMTINFHKTSCWLPRMLLEDGAVFVPVETSTPPQVDTLSFETWSLLSSFHLDLSSSYLQLWYSTPISLYVLMKHDIPLYFIPLYICSTMSITGRQLAREIEVYIQIAMWELLRWNVATVSYMDL